MCIILSVYEGVIRKISYLCCVNLLNCVEIRMHLDMGVIWWGTEGSCPPLLALGCGGVGRITDVPLPTFWDGNESCISIFHCVLR